MKKIMLFMLLWVAYGHAQINVLNAKEPKESKVSKEERQESIKEKAMISESQHRESAEKAVNSKSAEFLNSLSPLELSLFRNKEAFITIESTMQNDMLAADKVKNNLQGLGLPAEFASRPFLTLAMGSVTLEGISDLMGKVYRRTQKNGITIYEWTGHRCVTKGLKIIPREPSKGVLFKKMYTKTTGGGLSYLIGAINFTNSNAYEVLINDVAEASILADQMDLKFLYDTYNTATDKADYVVIMNAKCTSIVYSELSERDRRADLSLYGVGLDGNYYTKATEMKQDWKVGIEPVKLTDLLQGYTPK